MRLNFSFFDPGLRYRCHVMCYCAWLWMELPVTQSLDSFFFRPQRRSLKEEFKWLRQRWKTEQTVKKYEWKLPRSVTSTRQHFYWFCLLKVRFYLVLNNNYFEWIIKQLYSFIHSSVRRPFHPSKPVSPFVSSFRRSFFRPFVPSFVRPFIHLFTHSFVLLAYPCVVRMSRISNRTIGGHQSTGLLSREKQFKFKTIHLLRKPTNNLITTLDWKYAKIKTETGRRCPLLCFKMHEGINIKRNTFTANGGHGIVDCLKLITESTD